MRRQSDYFYGYCAIPGAFDSLKPRERLIYYCGDMMADRLSLKNSNRFAVDQIARWAERYYYQGKIELTQTRVLAKRAVGTREKWVNAFEYVAVGKENVVPPKRRRPKSKQ